jgi:hypothetical protein
VSFLSPLPRGVASSVAVSVAILVPRRVDGCATGWETGNTTPNRQQELSPMYEPLDQCNRCRFPSFSIGCVSISWAGPSLRG